MKRTIVYIDGFNLYYGAIREGPYKWLDLQRYFQLLRPHDDLRMIRYFTALISGPNRPNQEAYLKALATLPMVEIVPGRFKNKRVQCRVTSCAHAGDRFFPTQEEKRTDVNIGVMLVDDAHRDLCDCFVVVSGDSDLVPALQLVKLRFPAKELVVYVPSRNPVRGAAVEMRAAADKHRNLPLNLLAKAQLPLQVPDGAGGFIVKPASW